MPTESEKPEFLRGMLIEDMMEGGATRHEAKAALEDLTAMLNDPTTIKVISECYEITKHLPPADAAALMKESLRETIRRKEEAENPKLKLKVWTDSEEERRSKPKSGTPDFH